MEGQINDSAFDSAISTIDWKPNRPGMYLMIYSAINVHCIQNRFYLFKKEMVPYLKMLEQR